MLSLKDFRILIRSLYMVLGGLQVIMRFLNIVLECLLHDNYVAKKDRENSYMVNASFHRELKVLLYRKVAASKSCGAA